MEQTLIWCDLNDEQNELERILGDLAFSIQGSTPERLKIDYERRWREGERPILITKPKCFGFGLNWQQCSKMIFVGLSDSFEAYYQAVRRCWRFGQENPVDVYIIISDAEGAVKSNIERKQADAERMTKELVRFTKDILAAEIHKTVRMSESYFAVEKMEVPGWLISA